jgi:hypothetical protein
MEELLKSSRLIHYTLIVLSAAILLLALSPNRPLQYRRAIRQIESLTQMQFQTYEAKCSDVHKKIEATHAAGIVSQLTKEDKFRFVDDFTVWYPVYCSWPTAASALAEIRAFFESQNEVLVVTVLTPVEGLIHDSPRGMTWALEHNLNPFPKEAKIRLLQIEAPCLKQSTNSAIGNLEQKPTDFPCHGTVDVVFLAPMKIGLYATAFPESHRQIQDVSLYTAHYTGRLAMNWLKTQKSTYDALVANGEFLPDVLPFWNQVSSLAPQAAIQKLAEQSPPSRTLSMIGLQIDEDTAIWVGPLLLLFTLLFLLAHLDTIRKTISTEIEGRPTLFWIATMPSSLGGAMT